MLYRDSDTSVPNAAKADESALNTECTQQDFSQPENNPNSEKVSTDAVSTHDDETLPPRYTEISTLNDDVF